jgi:hypothetical protein
MIDIAHPTFIALRAGVFTNMGKPQRLLEENDMAF